MMPDLKTLKQNLNKAFKEISASPVDVAKIVNSHVIVRYEERDPETGGRTHEYLFTVCDLDGRRVPVSYESQELAERVIAADAIFDLKKIQEIVDKYSEELRKE